MKVLIKSLFSLAFGILCILYTGCSESGANSDPEFQENIEKQYWLDQYGNIDSTEISIDDFSPATDCKDCHESHYEEWNRSMHAYSMNDPVFYSGWKIEQDKRPDTGERFCIQCHNPVAFVSGYVPGEYIDGEISKDLLQNSSIPETIKEGIGCNFCHSFTALSKTISTDDNVAAVAEYHLNPGENIFYGPIKNPAKNEYHESVYNPIYHQSEICLPCHNLTVRGVKAEITFSEWHDVTAGGMVNALSCQSCHMPNLDGHHNHEFVGVDIDLTQDIPPDSLQYKSVKKLLQSSVLLEFGGSFAGDTIKMENGILSIPVTVKSLTAHSLPSGTSFAREAWLETIVKDAEENTIFSSGTIEGPTANLELSDTNLVLYTSNLLDSDGNTTNSVTDAFDIVPQMLPGLSSQVHIYEISKDFSEIDQLSISVRMRFRAFKPFLLEGEHSDLLARQPVFDIAQIDIVYFIP